jgi:hypothetical protein
MPSTPSNIPIFESDLRMLFSRPRFRFHAYPQISDTHTKAVIVPDTIGDTKDQKLLHVTKLISIIFLPGIIKGVKDN